MKKYILILLLLISSVTVFANIPFFTGYTGFLTNIAQDVDTTDKLDPQFTAEAFFSGQVDFSGKFLLRGEFYMQADDLIDQNIFEDPDSANAYFRIEELSGTFLLRGAKSSHFLSLFLGNFEPIGSDIFLQRQFGIEPISSRFTESWHGLCGASVYPFYGLGGSYIARFSKPISFGTFIYDSMQENELEELENHVINADLRFASVLPNIAIDTSFGFSFPLENSDDTGTKVILIVRQIQLHAGLTMLLGNKTRTSFFLQAGFNKLTINPSQKDNNKLSFSDLYFIIEPRFTFRHFNLDFGLFNIPNQSADDMLYLKNVISKNPSSKNLLGANISIVSDQLYFSNVNWTFGVHATFCWTDSNLAGAISDFKSILNWQRKLYITPFFSFPFFGGSINGSISLGVLDIMPDWKNSIYASLGFRSLF